jgi:hypothetical protein
MDLLVVDVYRRLKYVPDIDFWSTSIVLSEVFRAVIVFSSGSVMVLPPMF